MTGLWAEPQKNTHDPRKGYSEDLDLMLKNELGVMNLLLRNAGFQVDIATTSGSPIRGQTEKIEKLLRLVDIKLDDYVGIIMPCMAVGAFPGPPVPQEEFLKAGPEMVLPFVYFPNCMKLLFYLKIRGFKKL